MYGHHNQYLFTWSKDRSVWGFGSGCSTFYNTGNKDEVNIKMHRDYINNQFLFIAIKNITINFLTTLIDNDLEKIPKIFYIGYMD